MSGLAKWFAPMRLQCTRSLWIPRHRQARRRHRRTPDSPSTAPCKQSRHAYFRLGWDYWPRGSSGDPDRGQRL